MNLGINLNRSCHVISSCTDPVSACQGTFQETVVDHRYCWVGLPDIVASQKASEIARAMNISETQMQGKIRRRYSTGMRLIFPETCGDLLVLIAINQPM